MAENPHPLPKPKFSDRERAAWDWLHNRYIRGWLVDLATKCVDSSTAHNFERWKNIIEYAQHHGWEG